ncbi:hypothetical protein TNCV_4478461 [Trichonephila clavipes]|nr:hypothetical protein TNCV_4478461 [Trichonephila clavipes]
MPEWTKTAPLKTSSMLHRLTRGGKAGQILDATRGLLATDHVILKHGQVTWTAPELAPPPPSYHTTPTGGRFSS